MNVESQTHQSAQVNFRAMLARVYEHFKPPPDITVSEWAIRNRTLPKGMMAGRGYFGWRFSRSEMMNTILSPTVHEVVIQKCTQVGFTDAVLLNIIGYFIDADPRPIMYVLPTIDNAKDKGKKAVTPMIESCPVPARRKSSRPPSSRRRRTLWRSKNFPADSSSLRGRTREPDFVPTPCRS